MIILRSSNVDFRLNLRLNLLVVVCGSRKQCCENGNKTYSDCKGLIWKWGDVLNYTEHRTWHLQLMPSQMFTYSCVCLAALRSRSALLRGRRTVENRARSRLVWKLLLFGGGKRTPSARSAPTGHEHSWPVISQYRACTTTKRGQ